MSMSRVPWTRSLGLSTMESLPPEDQEEGYSSPPECQEEESKGGEPAAEGRRPRNRSRAQLRWLPCGGRARFTSASRSTRSSTGEGARPYRRKNGGKLPALQKKGINPAAKRPSA